MATAEHPIAMPDADKEDAIVVTVLRDGAVFLGSNRIDIGSLSQRVRDSLTNKVGKEAYIRADARANFRAVEDMIDLLRAAGVEGAGLLVGRKNADTQQNDPRFQEFSAGLELVVLPPPMLKHYFPKGIPESIDQVQILDGSGGIPAYKINQTAVQKAELLPKLTEMYKDRGERTLFIRADDDLDFASVVEVIDIAKGADVDHVAVLTPQMAASH
jgi:biopolymer transport protein ExbD